ncbi:hypothetical protein AYI70_g2276 [Smittium culicis]|uniref:Nucleoporin n=1 Tax=Smittium culicis TaxID=133412 RepID=A0A1R1Y8Z7_9FUNG|nr:hypothetical protein AYI70_g2276 [Smittium culicis]
MSDSISSNAPKRKKFSNFIDSTEPPSKFSKNDYSNFRSKKQLAVDDLVDRSFQSKGSSISKLSKKNFKASFKNSTLYSTESFQIDYQAKIPDQLLGRVGNLNIDSDSGFAALVSHETTFIWNFKKQIERNSDPNIYTLDVPTKILSAESVPHFLFVGVYDQSSSKKSNSDEGAIICYQSGLICYFERIKYGIIGVDNYNTISLELENNEHVINFLCVKDGSYYFAVTNLGNLFNLSISFESNDRKIKFLYKTKLSKSGFGNIALSLFSKLSKAIVDLSASSDNSISSHLFPGYRSARIGRIKIENNSYDSSALYLSSANFVELYKIKENNSIDMNEFPKSFDIKALINSNPSIISINANFESVIDTLICRNNRLYILFSMVLNNDLLTYALVSLNIFTGAIISNIHFLNVPTDRNSISRAQPKFVNHFDDRFLYISFFCCIISVFNKSTNNHDLFITQNFKAQFKSSFEVIGTSSALPFSNATELYFGLSNGGGIFKLTSNTNLKKYPLFASTDPLFVKSLILQHLLYGDIELPHSRISNPVDFKISEYLNLDNLNNHDLEDVCCTVSNEILNNHIKTSEIEFEIDQNIDKRISLSHRFNEFLCQQNLYHKFSDNLIESLLLNTEKLLAAADLYEYRQNINNLNSMYFVEDKFDENLLDKFIENILNSSGFDHKNIDEFFVSNTNLIDQIFIELFNLVSRPENFSSNNSSRSRVAYEANCIFMALVSSPLAYRLEFGSSIYSLSIKNSIRNWWELTINRDSILDVAWSLYNISFNVVKSFSHKVNSKLSSSIKSYYINPNFKMHEIKLATSNLIDHNRLNYTEIINNGVFLDNEIAPESISEPNVDFLRTIVDQLSLFSQIVILIHPLPVRQTIVILEKLVLLGKIGTSIRLANKIEYYDLMVSLVNSNLNSISSLLFDIEPFIDCCIDMFGYSFTNSLLSNYSKSNNLYSLYNFPYTQDFINSERLDSLSRFLKSACNDPNKKEFNSAIKLKWIHEISTGNYIDAFKSLTEKSIGATQSGSFSAHTNLFSLAKIVQLSIGKNVSNDNANNLEMIPLSFIDSQLNMNNLIFKLYSNYVDSFPIGPNTNLKESGASFDYENAFLENKFNIFSTSGEFGQFDKLYMDTFKNQLAKLSTGTQLTCFEFINIITLMDFQTSSNTSCNNNLKLLKNQASFINEKGKLDIDPATDELDAELSQDDYDWSTNSRFVVAFKLACCLELLTTPSPEYSIKHSDYLVFTKNVLNLLWIRIYLLDDWEHIFPLLDLVSTKSVDNNKKDKSVNGKDKVKCFDSNSDTSEESTSITNSENNYNLLTSTSAFGIIKAIKTHFSDKVFIHPSYLIPEIDVVCLNNELSKSLFCNYSGEFTCVQESIEKSKLDLIIDRIFELI